MIDWHSHILPEMDDGSHSVEESLAMLRKLSSEGVDTVIATPHFYANKESVDSFLERRAHSYELLVGAMSEDMPRVRLGAEVRYYQGISRLSSLNELKIEGTDLLLLEMPEAAFGEYVLKEIEEISCLSCVNIVIAHIERCLLGQKASVMNRLLECGVYPQANAEFFEGIFTRGKALRLLGEGKIAFIGSDCHDLKKRPPRLLGAIEIIKKKFGEEFLLDMTEYGRSLLGEK